MSKWKAAVRRPLTPTLKRLAAAAVCAALLACFVAPVPGAEPTLKEETRAAREAGKAYMSDLLDALSRALQQGGPALAISVCRHKAPAIAAEVSGKTGFEIRRTSLKPRNPENEPDAWERSILMKWQGMAGKGADFNRMEVSKISVRKGRRVFRYMKAIPVKPFCLQCHGSKLAPGVSSRLAALYPRDRAVGYKAGDLRGALTITRDLGPAKNGG
ncbi:MAG: DUF3365 domain-containing protein [Acidobacteriota bacterium]|jgi:hypothetical protein